MQIIEKKNQPVRTEISFTKKEWGMILEKYQKYLMILDHKITARKVCFYIDGDLLNGDKKWNEVVQEEIARRKREGPVNR